MHIKAAGSLLALFACSAFGQTDRVLRFGHTEGKQSIQEVGTLIRVIAALDVSTDATEKTLTLHGTMEQIGLAEWLFHELDKPQMPAPDNREVAAHEFHLQGNGENTVRLFYLLNTATIQDFQGVATAIRTVADIRRVSTNNGARAIAMRGTVDQIALAAFLVGELDQPMPHSSASPEYRMPANADPRDETVVRVFYITHAATIQDFQEIATAVRTIANIRRVTTYNAPKAMIVRSNAEAIALAGWVTQQLDKPAVEKPVAGASQPSTTYEYDTPYDRDNMVQVFYLPQTGSVQEFQQIATHIRTTANLRRVCTYNGPRAVAVRGTVDQLATAERTVKALEAPAQDR